MVATDEQGRSLNERWVRASAFDPLGGWLAHHIQQLGRLDEQLRVSEGRTLHEDRIPDDWLDEHIYLSRLWVLDAYEIIRSMRKFIRTGSWDADADVATRIERAQEESAYRVDRADDLDWLYGTFGRYLR